jgi:hypothetical protein
MSGAPLDMAAWQRNVILRNVTRDPHYAPYCMRCQGLVRMCVIARHYWQCTCGAVCDYRAPITEGGPCS